MKFKSELELLSWIDTRVKPFLEKNSPEKLASIQSDQDRLIKILNRSDEVTVCFLGNSGVGKSTLLNALAAGDQQVLPAGGIGPLTAQATEVSFSATHKFKVVYHTKDKLWQTVFAIESRLKRLEKLKNSDVKKQNLDGDESSEIKLSSDVIDEVVSDAASIEHRSEDGSVTDTLEGYVKQAKNIVCGNQFADKSHEYLVDCLRVACDLKTKWGQHPEGEDVKRIERVREIFKRNRDDRTYEHVSRGDHRAFVEDLKAHAAGFLSPLIERIDVGWPADVLKSGVKLVDLPGVGIAQDAYRDVTKSYVREKARAVIVVVDRAGPTEATVDLLRTSGYWDRLVGAADDPASDPCSMLIAVTKVDDVMQEEWANQVAGLIDGMPKPKKREVFAKLVEEFKPRMHSQIAQQLAGIGDSTNESVNTARNQARSTILETLEIHPVSAPEMRRILIDDEEDRSFLGDVSNTGIPQLQKSLSDLAAREKLLKEKQLNEVSQRLCSTVLSELKMFHASWQEDTRAAEEADRLSNALEDFLKDKKEEYRARAAAFREFLRETVQARIDALVLEAREEAEKDVQRYLRSLGHVHWGTLRAAVRRGGAFYGSRHINLPDDITGFFQEPMAAVWGQKLLRDIRRRTSELADDIEQLVKEVCDWAVQQEGAKANKKLLETQQERVHALAAQMKAVGKEAVDEMRETVKNELAKTIREPIKAACSKFVKRGDDIGPGVKSRVLELFNRLANDATTAAKEPAMRILREKAKHVQKEIQDEFKKGGDPLQDTANLIVKKHEDRIRRSDAQKRTAVLLETEDVLASFPG
jgi:GTP-binding protein EngB required for normal cell division/gas vesicle protein